MNHQGADYVLRPQRVILDRDLAALYGVTTARFPEDFVFQLPRPSRPL